MHRNMFKLAILFVLAAVAFGSPGNRSSRSLLDGRIVGGEEVKITDHPHQVSLYFFNVYICGGSIIGKKHVVTCAYCTDEIHAGSLNIRVGSNEINAGGTVVNVANIHQHHRYDPKTFDYDISVLELAEELTFGPTVGSIKLPDANEWVPAGTRVTVTGWGVLEEAGARPTKLQGVTLQVISEDDCKKAYGDKRITDRMICARMFGEIGQDACRGDAGGPLIAGKVLKGIVSWGTGCAHWEYPGVYTNVANLRDFIKEVSGI